MAHVAYKASKTAAEFMCANNFVRGIMGPVGSGKSVACAQELVRRAAETPAGPDGVRRSRWAVIRNTYSELRDTTVKTWLEWFPESACGPFLKQEFTHPIKLKNLHMEVLFRALDRPDDIKKLLSLELTGAWINEAREIPLAVLQMLEGRVGRYPRRADVKEYWSGIIMDTNPPDEDHWWYKLAEETVPRITELALNRDKSWVEALEVLYTEMGLGFPVTGLSEDEAKQTYVALARKYRFFRQPSGLSAEAENKEHLDPNYYQRIAMGKSPEWINVYVHGNYGIVMDGKPVYPEYNDSMHYNAELVKPIRGLKILRAWDFGRTPAVLFSQLDPQGRWLCFDELVSEDMAIDEFGDYVKKHCGENYPRFEFVDYCDPSGFYKGDKSDLTCAQILAAKGIDVEGAVQDPAIRIAAVSKPLRGLVGGKPEFQLGPKCRTLRKGFMGGYCYRRMQVSGERYTDKPDKNPYSHIHDCAQYTATMLYRSDLLSGEPEKEEATPWLYSAATEAGRSACTGY